MSKCVLFQIAVVVISAMVISGTAGVRITSCKSDPFREEIVRVDSLDVTPHPVQIKGDISLAGALRVLQPITGQIQAKVTMSRKLGPMWIDFPCMPLGTSGRIGSCTYNDLCGTLTRLNGTRTCQHVLKNHNIPCSCPVSPGIYALPLTKMPVDLSKLNIPMLAGSYRMRLELSDQASQQELVCYTIELEVASPSRSTLGRVGRFFSNLFG